MIETTTTMMIREGPAWQRPTNGQTLSLAFAESQTRAYPILRAGGSGMADDVGWTDEPT